MQWIRPAAVLVAVLFLAGCPRDDVYDPSIHPPSPLDVPPPDPVRVLETGVQPREVLRYRIPDGFSGRIDIRMAMRLMSPQEVALPPIRMRMRLFDVENDGDGFRYRFAFDEPVIEADGEHGLPPERIQALRNDVAAIAHIQGEASLDARGLLHDVAYDGEVPGLRLEQIMNELEQSVRQMTVPLPDEPVGVGARWEVTETLTLNELTFEQKVTMTLRERDGDRLVLDALVAQSGGRQPIHNPQLPPGAEMFVERLSGSAHGVSHIDLSSLVPHAPTRTRSTTRTAMEIRRGEQRQPVEMAIGVDLRIAAADDTANDTGDDIADDADDADVTPP